MSDKERIEALTRGYMTLANYTFNNLHDRAALFDLMMEAKREADKAIDNETRLAVFAEIDALPGNRTHFCDECGASVDISLRLD